VDGVDVVPTAPHSLSFSLFSLSIRRVGRDWLVMIVGKKRTPKASKRG
jgi:hypothetical protein